MNVTPNQAASATGITWLSLAVNVALGVLKCVVGLLAGSAALVADGLHSLTDLATDIAALFGLKMAQRPGDERHPYGHHKFSSLANLSIAGVLFAASVVLVLQSAFALRDAETSVPGLAAVGVAVLSVAVKEGLFWWTRAIAQRCKSRLLMANAWHHRTDSVSSVMVIVALLVAIFGGERWGFLDEMVGIGLGLYLLWAAVKLARQALDDLIDAAPGRDVLNDVREHILPIPGAVAYHAFRARRIGDMLEVDLHLQVPPEYSVARGHEIAREVKATILEKHPEVFDVLIHLEPADAEHLREKGLSDIDPADASG